MQGIIKSQGLTEKWYNLLMDKEILKHRDFVRAELKRLTKDKYDNSEGKYDDLRALASYHAQQTWNFQHERQIHLYVTIIFGVIMLAAWAVLFGWLLATGYTFDLVAWLLVALVAILTVLEGCYIGYYYRLENRTQTLYPLDKEIYRALQAMLK